MSAKYKQKCSRCKTNYALASPRERFVTCDECRQKDMSKEITDPEMKKMFDIPKEYYESSAFLKDIRISYARFGQLSERQIEAFKETVAKIKENKEK